MSRIRMDIDSVVAGSGSLTSLVVLKPYNEDKADGCVLPLRIGLVEAMSISMDAFNNKRKRPLTHDLMATMITELKARVEDVAITSVRGMIFSANITLSTPTGTVVIESRPSDALALAVRTHAPIYAEQSVIDTASMPNFAAAREEAQEILMERFHDFVETLSPEDFNSGN